jgi:hypothetical protein
MVTKKGVKKINSVLSLLEKQIEQLKAGIDMCSTESIDIDNQIASLNANKVSIEASAARAERVVAKFEELLK